MHSTQMMPTEPHFQYFIGFGFMTLPDMILVFSHCYSSIQIIGASVHGPLTLLSTDSSFRAAYSPLPFQGVTVTNNADLPLMTSGWIAVEVDDVYLKIHPQLLPRM